MIQKVIQIGTSIGVVIPKHVAQKTGVRVGDEIELIETTDGRLVFEKTQPAAQNIVSPDVVAWTNDFIQENRELLDRLKDR